ncbi:Piso0_003838 [Millerozyma farinosa CBS 7064]|uniref:Piso0_003838 protein n=1 Tax=Pichia sorbitophila (strain ATCC MYA-4447 / BCRC 22081 / CBS 7064 / NBRC 10061 / NRRL Y-12695) TaxID=559304 RepID=G8Y6R7_PICSO|nr:Piso0_003838 [Millerozyma farinosa CBS 7064]CCE84297.1 Piso0_003838 [Millerozyma farinosa CBS 7064]
MNVNVLSPVVKYHVSSSRRISAICTFNQLLFVGYSDGGIDVYNLQRDPQSISERLKSPSRSENESLPLGDAISRVTTELSPIRALSAVQLNYPILFVIEKTAVSLYRYRENGLKWLNTLSEGTSITATEIFVRNGRICIVMGIKRRLLFFSLELREEQVVIHSKKEYALKDKVKSILKISDDNTCTLLVGVISDFVVIDLEDSHQELGTINEINIENFTRSFSYFGFSGTTPSIHNVRSPLNEVFIFKDTQAALLTLDNNMIKSDISPINLHSAPLDVRYIDPMYLIMIYYKRFEVVNALTGDVVQKYHHNIASGNLSVSMDGDTLLIASGNDIQHFYVLDFKSQIDQYLTLKSQTVLKKSRDPKNDPHLKALNNCIEFVQRTEVNHEFFKDHLNDPAKQKELLLRDIFKRKALYLFNTFHRYHEALVEISSEWIVSYEEILQLFPTFIKADNAVKFPMSSESSIDSEFTNLKATDLEDSLKAEHSTESGTEDYMDSKHFKQTPAPTIRSLNIEESSTQINIRRFLKAVANLVIYLTEQRRIHSFFTTTDDKSVFRWHGLDITASDLYPNVSKEDMHSFLEETITTLDTTLFLCYYYTKPALIGPLLRLPNNYCDSKVVFKTLMSNQNKDGRPQYIKELLDFYFCRSLHENALEMLYSLLLEDADISQEANDLAGNLSLIVKYLQRLQETELGLVFKYCKLIIELDKDQRSTILEKVFMNDSFECETYDKREVYEYLMKDIASEQDAFKYLKWIILSNPHMLEGDKKEIKVFFHTQLGIRFISLIEINQEAHAKCSEKLFDEAKSFFLSSSYIDIPSLISKCSDKGTFFIKLKVCLLKRVHKHEEAVDILFHHLKDIDEAMKYCDKIYHESNSKDVGVSLFHRLLDNLLVKYNDNINLIEKLLAIHGSKMSTVHVISALPKEFPLYKLNSFLINDIKLRNAFLLDSRASRVLNMIRELNTREKLYHLQDTHYTISSSKQTCEICHQNLGYSMFSVSNDNKVVHYGCLKELSKNK